VIFSFVVVAPTSSAISSATGRKVAVEEDDETVAVDFADEDATTVARVVGVKVERAADVVADVAELVVTAALVAGLLATDEEDVTSELVLTTVETTAAEVELAMAAVALATEDAAAEVDEEAELVFEPGPETERVTSPLSMYTPLNKKSSVVSS